MRKKLLQSKLSSSAIARLGEVDIKLQLPRRTQQNFPQVSGQLSATFLLYRLHHHIKGLQGTGWNNKSNYLIHVGNNVFFSRVYKQMSHTLGSDSGTLTLIFPLSVLI